MRAALLLAATAVTANARPIWRADRAMMPALAASPADAKDTARARTPQTYTLTEPDFHGPGPGRQRVDKVSEETRTQFVALLTISRDDHSFSLTQAFTDAIDTAERRETAERLHQAATVPPPPARAAPPGGGGGAPGPP